MLGLLLACAAPTSTKSTSPAGTGTDPTGTGTEAPGTTPPPPPWTSDSGTDSAAPADSAPPPATTDTAPPVAGFTATVYDDVGGRLLPGLGTFDDTGCYVAGSAVPVDPAVAQVTDTPGGRWFAIGPHDFGEVDPLTGAYAILPGSAALTSWTMAIAPDAASDDVLVGTLAGVGGLLAFDPLTGALGARGDLDNHDVVALASDASGDVFALEHPGSGVASEALLRFRPTGGRASRTALSTALRQPDAGRSLRDDRRTWQLRSTALGLVAIVRSIASPPAETFLVDPATGAVTPISCP